MNMVVPKPVLIGAAVIGGAFAAGAVAYSMGASEGALIDLEPKHAFGAGIGFGVVAGGLVGVSAGHGLIGRMGTGALGIAAGAALGTVLGAGMLSMQALTD